MVRGGAVWARARRQMLVPAGVLIRSPLVGRLGILNLAIVLITCIGTNVGTGGNWSFGAMLMITLGVTAVLTVAQAILVAMPILRLVDAVEIPDRAVGRRGTSPVVRIPDLSGRSDEIGRLSEALREMIAALSVRIDTNERFAADVAHEIKNPLASLRSAVGSLMTVSNEGHRQKLLAILQQDVCRLDRLVTDVSNVSRLDSELVRGEQQAFDLSAILSDLSQILDRQASARGIKLIADLPERPVIIFGLESRLAQVFVNLVSNAISFCSGGDKVRIWSRQREARVLVVVEDTGPGIPQDALGKIFERFYSERPANQFGMNSGLGLAISKQIVEAHGGVIWAENIFAHGDSHDGRSRGARIVVGLPVQP